MRALLPFLIAPLPQFLLTTLAGFFLSPISTTPYLMGLYPRLKIILTRVCLHVHIVYRVLCVNDHQWPEMKHYIRAYGETQSKRCVFGLIEGGVLIKRVLSVVLNGLLSTVLKPTRRGERPVLHTPTVCGRDGERRGFRHTDDTNRCL